MTAILAPKDYATDQEVRWCPGCGDYAILKAVQKVLADLQASREKTVFVSGIGCSSRFPYYVSTYGFHTIHGRAPAIATGVKLTNPELDVWMITGDGDGLSHRRQPHAARAAPQRESPDPAVQQRDLRSHQGPGLADLAARHPERRRRRRARSIRRSFPRAFALGAGARFVARSIDTLQPHLVEVLKRAHGHKGASFVEIFQNCVVFNDGVFEDFTAREVAGGRAAARGARQAAHLRRREEQGRFVSAPERSSSKW